MAKPILGIVQMGEIAAMLGVSRQRANELSLRAGFPEPYGALSTGRVWLLEDVEAWAKASGRKLAGKR
jgi:hypothetical protein